MDAPKFKPKDFVHLHVHSDYSLLQSTIQLKALVQKLRQDGMSACALTDYGNMYGAVSFYDQMRGAGLRPILGYEAYVAADMHDRSPVLKPGERPFYNLVLLASSLEGYQNLVWLSSKGFTEGFYHKPRIDKALLAEKSDGLIAIAAGPSCEAYYQMSRGEDQRAAGAVDELRSIFGAENFFLGIQDHGTDACAEGVKNAVELSRRTGVAIVACNNAHYLKEEDARAHEALLCIGEGRQLDKRLTFDSTKLYLRSSEEMWDLFGNEHPEALRNTLAIAERCEIELPSADESRHLPVFPVPPNSGCGDIDSYFEQVVREGFEERRSQFLSPMLEAGRLKHSIDEYEARLKTETEIIERMKFPSYFLVVWDFIRFAVERGIPVGPGRGSAAGSLVAYCLGITDVDPLQYDLLFERFLNPERVSMPDIDIDFCIRGRGKVIEHVTELYGRDSVCQIITFGTMASRAAIKDVGRALGLPFGDVEKIAKLIPPPIRGRNVSITQAIEKSPELKAMAEKDPKIADLLDLALRLEGCARHSSVHAAGVVISPRPLHEIVPVAVSAKNELTSQFSMNDLERVGMLKMDFLALTTLTVISDCLASLKEKTGLEIDWTQIPLNDEKTMKLFGDGRTDAVFQFESSGMQEICRRLKPKELEDLSALNALYRPGPLDGGMIEDFIARHRGEKRVEYLLPELKEILSNTYGVLVYQEQIMQIAQKLAGYSLGEADMMRRAMGKKKREAMAKEEKKFLSGAQARGINEDKARAIFNLMSQFADYGFNRSHSIAYAYLAFQTAYLKAHYLPYYYAAVLSHEADDTAKVYKYSNELRSMGLQLLPPDVNESDESFTPSGDSVRFGLGAIKGIGTSTISAITSARRSGKFASIFDLAGRIDQGAVGRRGLESLVTSGAFDSLKPQSESVNAWRARNYAAIDAALAFGQKAAADRLNGQSALFGNTAGSAGGGNDLLPAAVAWSQTELSQHEKEAVGFYLSSHPLDEHDEIMSALKLKDIADIDLERNSDNVLVKGVISQCQVRFSKKGNRFCSFRLEDRSGGIKCLAFSDTYGRFAGLLKNDELVIIEGRLENSENDRTLFVSDVKLLSEASYRNACQVRIRLPLESDSRTIDELFSVLTREPGKCEVLLTLPVGNLEVQVLSAAVRTQGSRAVHELLTSRGCSVDWVI
jgi:DNA polymerase III subunit alpha